MMKVEDGKEEVKHCFIRGQLYEGLCLCVWSIILFQVMIRQAKKLFNLIIQLFFLLCSRIRA